MRLTATLAFVGAIAGLLIVGAYTTTHGRIEENREATIDRAVHDVLQGIARYERIEKAAPEKVYAGFSADGTLVGFAVVATEPGFQDPIEILYGYDPHNKKVLGLAILMSRETPGLGDKIQGEGWLAQFRARLAPLVGTKKGAAAGPSDVDMITGATISSRAVINAVNKSAARWEPELKAYASGDRQ